jgi:protein-S-isoprenylcysteine O-methyltransferase Ste14
MLLNYAVTVVLVVWIVSELVLTFSRRARGDSARIQDSGSFAILYGGIFLGVTLAVMARGQAWAHININFYVLNAIILVILLLGLVIRWYAIITLGRFFTTNVAVQSGHRVVQEGPYRWVRHPSYSGGLLCFLGLGLALANWLSVVLLLIPVVAVYLYRMQIEEKALSESLGQEYVEYCQHTKRLIPGIY